MQGLLLSSLVIIMCIKTAHQTTAASAIREARHLKVVTLIMNELELMQFIIYITVYHGSLASSNLRKDANILLEQTSQGKKDFCKREAVTYSSCIYMVFCRLNA